MLSAGKTTHKLSCVEYFFFQSVPRDTGVLIVSFRATLHIMEHVVVRCVNVQRTCVMLRLAVKSPTQQVKCLIMNLNMSLNEIKTCLDKCKHLIWNWQATCTNILKV